jgi:hypothetical protein
VREDVAGAFSVRVTFTVLEIPPPEIVTVPVLFPTTAVAVFTLAVIVPLFEPDGGFTVSQFVFALLVTAQVPFEVTAIV